MNERAGFDADTWRLVRPFDGRIATPADVEEANAVFALADTINARLIETEKPAPVVWRGEDEDYAALLVQAEAHESIDGGDMEVAGLLLPTGQTAVALMEDVEPVSEDDPVWLSLIEADLAEDENWADENLDDEDIGDEDEGDDDLS